MERWQEMTVKIALAAALTVVLVPLAGYADIVTPEEAMTVGENFIDHHIQVRGGWGESPWAEISELREIWRGDRLLGYHISVSPNGHIVVPITRALTPVKSFSYTEDFVTQSEVGYWQLLKDAIEYSLIQIEENHGALGLLQAAPQPKAVGDTWDWALGSSPPPEMLTTIGPIVMTQWNQSYPWNLFCPEGDGGRTIVGCVATAGAQIMRYWRHPSYGAGSHSYYWNGDQSCGGSTAGRTLSGDFDHPYDWWKMKRTAIGYDSINAAAASQLCLDVGIAWQMDYGRCGSGAYTARGLTVYPTWFKYLNTVKRRNRPDYGSRQAWFDLLKAEFEIDPPRPIHYRISGHSIVCDGVMDDGGLYIHLNYGWAGSSDAWYAVDSLHCTWSGCDPSVEYALVGIDPGADFIDATDGFAGDNRDTYGLAWGDYNGDGFMDLYLANDGAANRLLEGDGTGNFTDVTAPPLGDTGDGRGVAWADYDNDGDLDLYLCNTSGGANKLFENAGGSFTDVTSGPLGDTGNSEGMAWGDFDGNGYVDLYIVNNGASNKLLLNTGTGSFTDGTSGPLGDTGNGYGVAAGDYDNDGDLDIYIVNSGANRLFENQGGGVFTDATSGPLGNSGDGRGAAWGDYDNDEDLDLYITNHGANALLRNDGGSFTDVTSGALGNVEDGYGAAWADYENDGDLDLFFANSTGENKIMRNRGGDDFQNISVDPLDASIAAKGAAWGDYDNDGLSDLYVANSAGSNYFYHNEYQRRPGWLKVKLVGAYSNAAGIGARVRVVAGGEVQTREISGGSGYCSQNSLIARFGLRDLDTVDSVQVIWPSGIVTDTTLVAVDQLIVIEEFDIAGVNIPGDASAAFMLFPSYPNPFGDATTIRYSLAGAGRVALRVYDVSGRVIRTLVDANDMAAGEHAVHWKGDNDSGAEVASGVYFYRIEAGPYVETRRMVLLR
jgi:hypothetical protein